MSQFYTPSPMSATSSAHRPILLRMLVSLSSVLALLGCSTPGQQQANAEIKALNAQNSEAPGAATQPYLGAYGPNDPPRLSPNSGYDSQAPQLSEEVALPFLSFLIIEPDPIVKNAVPSDVEKLLKTGKYPEAIDLVNKHIKKSPRNVQLRFLKARLQIEQRQFDQAKKTLLEITQQFPELPEPYNNLAALAANQDQWIQARDYLELALKLRPSYAIASANLGEVYIRLSAKAYEDAADAQPNQRQYSNRAKALRELLKPTPRGSQVAPASKPIPTTN
ncbi:tetratricopeptide repeat protein [Polynucleobacter sp. Latsch14-2]|nr:tetratricopeptide repeat protein [Polynucleobacter sp. Latsch14-2]